MKDANIMIKLIIPEIPPSNNKYMGRGSAKYQAFAYQDRKKKMGMASPASGGKGQA
jgi:hypothetical protein